jgi:predicted dehydrogenase
MGSVKQLGIGVIGRGFGARVVAPSFDQTEGCRVVEVVSPRDETAVAALCARADVDLIAVHSPPFLHLDNVRRAIDGGHAVLCDKPFGRNAEEATAMRDLAADAKVLNFLNFELRFDPAHQRLHALVQDGAVGEPLQVLISSFLAVTRVPLRRYGWVFDAQLGGGWIGAWGTHQIDFLRWTFGEIEGASAERRTLITERPDAEGTLHRCTAEDAFTASLRSASGVSITIESTSAAGVSLPARMVVIGRDAALELIGGQRILRYDRDGVTEVFQLERAEDIMRHMQLWAGVVRDAIYREAVEEGSPTFADGLACAEVVDRLRS